MCKAGIDFSKLGKGQNATCPDCGQEHRTFNQEDDTCIQCQFHRTHPELAPKYWTWARLDRNSWAAVCTWPENEEPPEPGQAIEIHRQDGRSSIKTITEVRPARFDQAGNLKVTCLVSGNGRPDNGKDGDEQMITQAEHRTRLETAIRDAKNFVNAVQTGMEKDAPDFGTIAIEFDNMETAAKRGFLHAYRLAHPE